MNSSTSSSKIPVGVLWAIAFIVLAEIVVRLIGVAPALRFHQGFAFVAPPDFTMVTASIDLAEAPDVLIVGSSRARDSVVVPDLDAALDVSAGSDIRTLSYAQAGAEIYRIMTLVDRLEHEGQLPGVFVYCVTTRQIRNTATDPTRALFVAPGTLQVECDRHGPLTETEMTAVWGNASPFRISSWRFTMRYRLLRMDPFASDATALQNPATGGLSAAQLPSWDNPTNLQTAPPSDQQVRDCVEMLYDESDPIGDAQVATFVELVDRLRSLGVQLVVVEIPTSSLLAEFYPAGLETDAQIVFRDATDGEHWYPQDQGRWPDELFREQSNLNRAGADRFTRELATILAPIVAERLRVESTTP